jgi:hypothetical protein
MARAGREAKAVEQALRRAPLASDLQAVLVAPAGAAAMAGDQPRPMPANDQRIGKVANEPLPAASLLGPEDVADKCDPDRASLQTVGSAA